MSDYVLEYASACVRTCVRVCVCSLCSFFFGAIARDAAHVSFLGACARCSFLCYCFFIPFIRARCCDMFDSLCIFARSRTVVCVLSFFSLCARVCMCVFVLSLLFLVRSGAWFVRDRGIRILVCS